MTIAQMFVQLTRRLEDIEEMLKERTDEVVDLDGACDLVGLRKPTIYALTSAGEIPHYKRGKKLYFRKSELQRWLTTRKVHGSNELAELAGGIGRVS